MKFLDNVEISGDLITDDMNIDENISDILKRLTELENNKTNLDSIYPVGSIYISVNSTDPSTLLGGGTWERFGKGKTLVSIDEDDTDFSTIENTGGEKTHTLTVSEMPSHSHTYNDTSTGSHPYERYGNYVTFAVKSSTQISTSSTGGSQAHNNLQPYITVYMWKRVA